MSSNIPVSGDIGAKKAPRVPSWIPTFESTPVVVQESPIETPAQRRVRMDAMREQRLADLRERVVGATFGNATGVGFDSPRFRTG